MAITKVESYKERLLSRKGFSDFNLPSSDDRDGATTQFRCFRSVSEWFAKFCNNLQIIVVQFYQMGRSDPRKVAFAFKMGLSLGLVSLVIFFKEPLKDINQYAIWAILTVVLVFEFSVGATLSKGLNRALGTFSAGGLALGIAEVSIMAGQFEEIVIVLSIFIAGYLTI
ncbi:hypothetical protein TIFTF001_008027 [Ficus carica]|uniref:Aluminum-activated malate transporter n=1 Tax=Ficus carica TaxID=3494 RepID=A0AA87ZU52_FICCA|nr:hypothetical protein TIFTF001_008027 [Ficus carica]